MTEPLALAGRGRMLVPPGAAAPARLTLDEANFTLELGDETRVAAYRDLEAIAVQEGAVLLVLGSGPGAERVLLDQFGSAQGQLVRELRDRRLRQRAADAFVTLPADEAIDLVEYDDGAAHGVGQLACHAWGVLLVPLDERLPPVGIRRSHVGEVRSDDPAGSVTIGHGPIGGGAGGGTIRLIGLGSAARVHADRLSGLRTAAQADAARIVGALVPDASYPARQEAGRVLIDGNPAVAADLPLSWPAIETGVLVDPTFAGTYQRLRSTAGSLADARAIALAPVEPGGDGARSWFLVPLPGNLIALELVSEGAHATYAFRIQPRSTFAEGATDRAAVREAVRSISEALVDSRFLREPMALPDDALAQPRYLRYRLALAVLPSLAAARERFVARIVHRDDASWAAALDDLIAWHGSARDDAAVWPGRSDQEAMVSEAEAGSQAEPTDEPPGDTQGAT